MAPVELTLLVCLASRQLGPHTRAALKETQVACCAAKASALGQGSPLLPDEQAPLVGRKSNSSPWVLRPSLAQCPDMGVLNVMVYNNETIYMLS